MPTRNINLNDHDDQFVRDQIAIGRYKNASEVLRAGLRLLEQQQTEDEKKTAVLRRLASEGFESLDRGEGIVFEDERELANVIGKIGRRAAKRARRVGGE
jgi:antitoxin ParD1/3/4